MGQDTKMLEKRENICRKIQLYWQSLDQGPDPYRIDCSLRIQVRTEVKRWTNVHAYQYKSETLKSPDPKECCSATLLPYEPGER